MLVSVFSVAGSVLGATVWDNGTYSTSLPALSIGWNQSASTPFRFALTDDFTVASPVELTTLTCYGHMSGNDVNEPQVIAGYVRILADAGGVPGDVLMGDWVTPLAVTEGFTGDFAAGSASRPIYKVDIALPNWVVCPGTYWVQFNVDNSDIRPSNGSLTGNYFSTLVPGAPFESNGYHYDVLTGQYYILDDPNTGAGNAPPFILFGDVGCAVPGDVDGDGVCTGKDIAGFVAAFLGNSSSLCADVNGDCTTDEADVAAFVACLLS